MNDETTAQLTSQWPIPKYAQENLWIETETTIVQTEGEFGLFALDAPAQEVTVRWCGVDGPALARLNWQADTLEWDGQVAIGGYIDTLHMMAVPGTDIPIIVCHMGGQPLNPTASAYPGANMRSQVPYVHPEFHAGLAAEISESVTTWIVLEDNPLAALVRDALVANMRLYLFGSLADDESGWGQFFALPLLLEAISIFPT